jgi:phosphomannomutase
MTWEQGVASGFVRALDPAVHRAYLEHVASLAIDAGPRKTKIVYTPLHGTGAVDRVLRAAGFEVELLASQATPDGSFPTVPGRHPNPERPEAMQAAIDRATAIGAPLVLASDPDADRIGCAVRGRDGRYVCLDGNQIAALVVRHALTRKRPGRPLVVKTEVTSTLVERVASGSAFVGDLLVGFKYVAEGLRALDEDGSWRGFSSKDVWFAAGCEESHGVLVTDQIRDKDAAGGGLFLAEAADRAAAEGRTLLDVLDELATKCGRIRNTQLNLAFPGATGQSKMMDLFERWAKSPPAELGGRKVEAHFDHRDPSGRFGPILSASDRASRTVLVFQLAGESDDGARVILRPSGTEPKLKVYLEQIGTPGATGGDEARWTRLLDDVKAALK